MQHDTNTRNAPYDILLLTAGFLVLFMFGLRTISGADIWLHLAAGRNAILNGAATIDPFAFSLPPGTAWLQTTWLYDIMVYKFWMLGGSALIVLLHAAAVVSAFLLLIPVCRKYSGQVHQAGALLISCWMLAPLFTLRPLLFSLFFIALHINILSRKRISVAAGVVLVLSQLLWANMHTSFILGICLVAIRAWEALSLRKKQSDEELGQSSPPRFYAMLIAILAAVSLINPAGVHLYSKALEIFTKPEGGVMLEWVSSFYSEFLPMPTGFITTIALILIASVFIFYKSRLPGVLSFCAIISAFLMVRSDLTLELSALLAFPFMALSIATIMSFTTKIKSTASQAWIAKGVYAIIALLIAFSGWMVMTNRYYVSSGSASAFGFGINTDAYPVAAMGFIEKDHKLPSRTLNIAHDGGYMLWHQGDGKVFTDPRGDLYGGLFYQRLAKGLLGNDKYWNDLITRYDPEGVLLNATWTGAGTVVYHLISRGGWVISYFDGTSVLMVRKTASNRALIEDEELQKKGLSLIDESFNRYKRSLKNPIIRPPNPSRLIGASAVLQALGRYEESLRLFSVLTEGVPRMATAWVNRGIAEVNLNKADDAIHSLEHALKLMPSNPIALLWLGEAYTKAGRKNDAAMAVDQAHKINPKIVGLFKKGQKATQFQAPEE